MEVTHEDRLCHNAVSSSWHSMWDNQEGCPENIQLQLGHNQRKLSGSRGKDGDSMEFSGNPASFRCCIEAPFLHYIPT